MIKRFDKAVVVTRKTQVEELIERFNSLDQARFYITSLGGDFEAYHAAHETYLEAAGALRAALSRVIRAHFIERGFLPTFTFDRKDLVITLGPDGLVVNTAKYLTNQPLLAFNPDPVRLDGVLIPFTVDRARDVVKEMLSGSYLTAEITMASARLNDGRTILAVNDLFIGQKTHVSARYRLQYGRLEEVQSSSGIIVSTGAGSTGWHRSILAGAAGEIRRFVKGEATCAALEDYRFDPESKRLAFHVREPFASRSSGASIVQGEIVPNRPLIVHSMMPQNGVIFSDGIEVDFLDFNSGSIANIGIADRTVHLVVRDAETHGESGGKWTR